MRIHAIVTAEATRESRARPNVTKMEVRCFIITATALSTLPSGPCSASRWPKTVEKEATYTVYMAKAIVQLDAA